MISTPSTYSGYVPLMLSSCTNYHLRFKAVNAIGAVVVPQAQMTVCPFTALGSVVLYDSTTATDTAATFHLSVNCHGRNATGVLKIREDTATTWQHVISLTIDTTRNVEQNIVKTVGGLKPSHNYYYDVTVTNINGPAFLGTKSFRTADTVLASTGILDVSHCGGPRIVTGGPVDSIVADYYFDNEPGGIGSVAGAFAYGDSTNIIFSNSVTRSESSGIQHFAAPVTANGMYWCFAWITDNLSFTRVVTYALNIGYTKSTASLVSTVQIPPDTKGKVIMTDMNGKLISEHLEFYYSDIWKLSNNKNIPSAVYIANFISDDGQFTDPHKIFVH